ncbi:MAG: RIP metalloprotease RseP [Candidatus Coprovivens sp.]
MGTILSIITFILMLGILVFVHEFGHFITAKKSGVHIYEFAIGMGPLIKTIEGKDGIKYSIRALPIGGFVQMAGEVYEDDETKKIPKDKFLCNKPWYQRLIILCAGVFNNFVLAIVLLFFLALTNDVVRVVPVIDEVTKDTPAEKAGLKSGDRIVEVEGTKASSWDKVILLLSLDEDKEKYDLVIERDGKEKEVTVKLEVKENKDGTKSKVLGVTMGSNGRGFTNSLRYAFEKFYATLDQMAYTVGGLFTGKVSINALSGPVGIFEVVDKQRKQGLSEIIYLTAYLSINLGLMNILPIPALDGGHVLFVLVELITRKKVNAKVEGIATTIFFFLLMALMLYVTIHDIIRLIL